MRCTRTYLITFLVTLAVTAVAAGCTSTAPTGSMALKTQPATAPALPSHKTTPRTGPSTPATATPPGANSGAGLPAEDPDHGNAQPFPASGTCHNRPVPNGTLPDPVCTPGATDPHVTQTNLPTTICRPGGYTSTVRPPVSVTSIEKRVSITAYTDTGPVGSYEFDHLVPLELGGSPNSPHNLWSQPGASPNPKDKLETALHDLACSHRMTLTDAQTAIASDWITTYHHVLGITPPSS